eukprot:3695106-Amphidinium_carterae.1
MPLVHLCCDTVLCASTTWSTKYECWLGTALGATGRESQRHAQKAFVVMYSFSSLNCPQFY